MTNRIDPSEAMEWVLVLVLGSGWLLMLWALWLKLHQ
jgi:hypothetical protein